MKNPVETIEPVLRSSADSCAAASLGSMPRLAALSSMPNRESFALTPPSTSSNFACSSGRRAENSLIASKMTAPKNTIIATKAKVMMRKLKTRPTRIFWT